MYTIFGVNNKTYNILLQKGRGCTTGHYLKMVMQVFINPLITRIKYLSTRVAELSRLPTWQLR